ncbi:arp2/3 complex-activating protein rickA-like isoform X2 [Ostrea edulis]|uniref:arp2/3 complex-activating protein rickA-like isoform X2 n=1 Tax=Ostrea edulis TaxID=37623 RepID=UPI0024AE9036|nr:arp2/3 complex-activating protein rickA-like isoform X2 [Ostrea edulis]XP_056002405.1 arp2/3 complex-activating protein rickA-like isoform X2 [Ostrea edulis]XP_056003901.1 arp2/3 complex-activating protein rickA-like isoform X2 [Ostrea edulis]XP_056004207.1 arp2/3 complex-activating protein rickA-like isoform X2 [Ostrea edulis]
MEGGHVIKNPCRIYPRTHHGMMARPLDLWLCLMWIFLINGASDNCKKLCWPIEGIYDCTKSGSRCVRMMRSAYIDTVREIRVFNCEVQLVTDRVVTNWPVIRDRNFNRCPQSNVSSPPPITTTAEAQKLPSPPPIPKTAETQKLSSPPPLTTTAEAHKLPSPPPIITTAETQKLPSPPPIITTAETQKLPSPPPPSRTYNSLNLGSKIVAGFLTWALITTMGVIVVAVKQCIKKKLLRCPCECRNNPPNAPENPPNAPENIPLNHPHTPPQAASTPTSSSNLSPTLSLETTLTTDTSTTSTKTLIESPVSSHTRFQTAKKLF